MTCGVVELRQYALAPGRRQALIDLFEQEFVESQQAVGIHVIGTFTDLDDPDNFVWLRGFRDHAARNEALPAFYYGPVWAAHRDRANATMRDSDNVLMLRSSGAGPAFPVPSNGRAPATGAEPAPIYAIGVYPVLDDASGIDVFRREVLPRAAGDTVALLRSDPAENGFPRLPVREGERVLVWVRRFADRAVYDRHVASADRPAVPDILGAPQQELRLMPTRRSRLR